MGHCARGRFRSTNRSIGRYIDQPTFREAVRQFADGLRLVVLEANDRELFLGTQDESVFAVKASEFRGGRGSAEDRLLDGLVQVAIAATIYPRQQDLDEDSMEAKPPITSTEVDETLRHLCTEFNGAPTIINSCAAIRPSLRTWAA